ncbi:MAG: hypothetical protein ACMUFK_00385 [Thermoplasmatota archaeon]
MRPLPLILIGIMLCTGIVALIPEDTDAAPNWEAKHLYVDQWLYFEIGTLDQGTEIEYGIRVTTQDESVNLAFMDSTNYAAFTSDLETFVGWDVQYQVRQREATTTIPYQQMWYFVARSDSWSEIDIEYYVNVIEEDSDGICGGVMLAGALMIFGMIGVVILIKKR